MPILKENQRFEHYRILRWLGNGISGESYEAEDTLRQRKVTFKLIHPGAPLPASARRQFFREMQDISRLNSPHLASVLAYGDINGQLYVVRRYVNNGSLLSSEGRLWFSPPLSVSDALHYCYQLAQTLEYIHNNGYLHGSLTLSNILVLRNPNTEHEEHMAPFLLADVGLANYVQRFGQPSHTCLPMTAAPEQLGKRATTASDQFALAVLVYFWLSGRPPYLGSPEEIEQLKLTATILPLAKLNSKVTFEQEAALHRALNVYPEERYPTILTFAKALLATLTPPSELTPMPQQKPSVEVFPEDMTLPRIEAIPDLEFLPTLQTETVSVLEIDPQPIPDPIHPAPDIPQPMPDPNPDPLPQPAPEPAPQPAPEPLPQPDIEPLPQPAPDIPQPISPPTPNLPPNPEAEVPTEILPIPSFFQELLPRQDLPSGVTPYLIITLVENEEMREFIVEQNEITFGRAGSSDILLDQDTLTSRHHARLKYDDKHFIIYDQRSANGVFVNGQKVTSETGFALEDGDHISIGNYEIIFRTKLRKVASARDSDISQRSTLETTAIT